MSEYWDEDDYETDDEDDDPAVDTDEPEDDGVTIIAAVYEGPAGEYTVQVQLGHGMTWTWPVHAFDHSGQPLVMVDGNLLPILHAAAEAEFAANTIGEDLMEPELDDVGVDDQRRDGRPVMTRAEHKKLQVELDWMAERAFSIDMEIFNCRGGDEAADAAWRLARALTELELLLSDRHARDHPTADIPYNFRALPYPVGTRRRAASERNKVRRRRDLPRRA